MSATGPRRRTPRRSGSPQVPDRSVLAVVERNGVVEAWHRGAVAIVDSDRNLIARAGDIDLTYFVRSSAKPFQALVSQRLGADLEPAQMALACASHDGDPVHLATVARMLEQVGLSEENLGCPPGRPLGSSAARRVGDSPPRRLWHNCSGKHAAMLRACLASGYDLASYLDPAHPLQQQMLETMRAIGGATDSSPGVDGCGAPVFVVSTGSLATAFGGLYGMDEAAPVVSAMHTYPGLVSGYGNDDAILAVALDCVAKRGAEGLLAVAVRGRGAIAVKSFDGSSRPLGPVMLDVLEQLGWVPDGALDPLRRGLAHPVYGGGRVQGRVRSTVDLDHA